MVLLGVVGRTLTILLRGHYEVAHSLQKQARLE